MKRLSLAPLARSLAVIVPLAFAACEVLPPPPPPHVEPPLPDPAATAPAAPRPPTVEEARAFVSGVDTDLRRLWVASSRASWVAQNFITDDTEALSASAEEASMEYPRAPSRRARASTAWRSRPRSRASSSSSS